VKKSIWFSTLVPTVTKAALHLPINKFVTVGNPFFNLKRFASRVCAKPCANCSPLQSEAPPDPGGVRAAH